MLTRFSNFLAQNISPAYCFECRDFLEKRSHLCQSCLKNIKFIVSKQLFLSKNLTLSVHALGKYQAPIKSFILAKHSNTSTAFLQLAELIWQYSAFEVLDFDCLVPIPLHWTKKITRGFNQAEELAQVLSQKSGKPIVKILQKPVFTKSQASLDMSHRITNLTKAFCVDQKLLTNFSYKKILLVDDVMTTGSTLIAAGRELSILKPISIMAIVGARVE